MDASTIAREPNAEGARSSRSILVVDDDDIVRSSLARLLRSEGYAVREAASGEQALELLKESRADAVLSDHLMPDMRGIELLTRIRDRYPDCLRIMITGHAEMDVAIRAINQGEVYRLITKPWDNTELKVMFHIAFEELDEERERRVLLSMIRTHSPLANAVKEHAEGGTTAGLDD